MRRKSKWILLGVFLLSLIPNLTFANEGLSENQITEIIKREVDNGRSPSIVVGIINEQGKRIFAYGKMDKNSNKMADGNTLYEIGSITKTFTAITLEYMVEQGELSLHDPISKFLPPNVNTPSRNGKEITLLDLVSHHSGLPRRPENMRPNDPNNPYSDYTVTQLYDFLSNYQLTRDIGEKFEYSNLGFGLLGHILCLKSGMDFEPLVHRYICDPLKMNNTLIKLTPEYKSRMATGYDKKGLPAENWDLSTLAGAGALRSNANDMLIYLGANLGLIKTNLTPIMMKTHIRRASGTPDYDIALGWLLSDPFDTHDIQIVWHDGATGGYRTFIGFEEKKKTGVVILSNSANDISDIGFHLLESRFPMNMYVTKHGK